MCLYDVTTCSKRSHVLRPPVEDVPRQREIPSRRLWNVAAPSCVLSRRRIRSAFDYVAKLDRIVFFEFLASLSFPVVKQSTCKCHGHRVPCGERKKERKNYVTWTPAGDLLYLIFNRVTKLSPWGRLYTRRKASFAKTTCFSHGHAKISSSIRNPLWFSSSPL